jgi:predicted RNA binding protein YcfA (HicA-like mRNA interferase family)
VKLPADLRPLAKRLRAHGWTIEPTKGSHIAWRDAEGVVRHVSASTTNARGSSIRNSKADIMRAAKAQGIDLRGRGGRA